MEPLTLLAIAAFALVILIRKLGWFSPALITAVGPIDWAPASPGDDEEQMPETDRAPRIPRLPWLGISVACVLALRVGLLLTLHA
jgi:hypothetical protein